MAMRTLLPFNPATMKIRDAEKAVESLSLILQTYDRCKAGDHGADETEANAALAAVVAQIRDGYELD